jgi:ribosomal-protein-alanine N-acetyltransferase
MTDPNSPSSWTWKLVDKTLILPPEPLSIYLKTERLTLREVREDDLCDLVGILQDPKVLRHLGYTQPWSETDVRRDICAALHQGYEERRSAYKLVIVLENEEQVIGDCGLDLLYLTETSQHPSAAILYLLLRSDQWGNGYATEAGQALVRFAFEELDLPILYAGCHPENAASRRVLEKLGMHFEGEQLDYPGAPEGIVALAFCLERKWCLKSE